MSCSRRPLKRAAIIFNPDTAAPVWAYMFSFETAARSLKVEPIIAHVRSDREIEAAIRDIGSEPGGGLVVSDPFMTAHRAPVILAAARNNVPAVYNLSVFARDGGLLSYGPDLIDNWRRAASYVDRILRGAKPAELPVQLPTKFEMAARSLKVVPIIAAVHSDVDIEAAIIALGREPGGSLVVMPDVFMVAHRAPVISAAARNSIPAVYFQSDFARDGGLLSYGPDFVDNFRRTATYVDRILLRCEAGRSPGAVPDQVRDGREPQDCQRAGACHSPIEHAARR